MRYIVDGYNLLFALASVIDPFEKTREKFIALFNLLSSQAKLKITLIFDTHKAIDTSDLPSVKTYHGIDIIYAPSDLSCDDYIIEMLVATKTLPNWTIVTSDKKLRREAREHRVLVITTDEFIQLINHKTDKIKKPQGKPHPNCSPQDYERWLKLFEKKKIGDY